MDEYYDVVAGTPVEDTNGCYDVVAGPSAPVVDTKETEVTYPQIKTSDLVYTIPGSTIFGEVGRKGTIYEKESVIKALSDLDTDKRTFVYANIRMSGYRIDPVSERIGALVGIDITDTGYIAHIAPLIGKERRVQELSKYKIQIAAFTPSPRKDKVTVVDKIVALYICDEISKDTNNYVRMIVDQPYRLSLDTFRKGEVSKTSPSGYVYNEESYINAFQKACDRRESIYYKSNCVGHIVSGSMKNKQCEILLDKRYYDTFCGKDVRDSYIDRFILSATFNSTTLRINHEDTHIDTISKLELLNKAELIKGLEGVRVS